jgi:hypothetical protein
MHIADRAAERSAGIMVSFDSEDFSAPAPLCNQQDDIIWHVSKGNQDIRLNVGRVFGREFIVGDDEQVHWGILLPC